MRGRTTMLLFAFACGFALHGSGETKPVTVEFYEVSGTSAQELRKELDRLGPVDGDGVRHDGHTRWFINWTYQLEPDVDGCEVRSFETTLDITMTLPRWKKSKTAPGRLVRRWEQYIAALRLHENGHRDIALAAAEEIRRRFKGRRDADDCQSLAKALNRTAEIALGEYRRQEVVYDEQTQHGRTQGAQFP